jgi:hypothetical protein
MTQKKNNMSGTLYRIYQGQNKVFESPDKNVVIKELSRLNLESVKEINEKELGVEDRSKYDLRIYRDPQKPISKSSLFHDNFGR